MALTLTLCTILISMALVYGRPHDDSQQTTFQPTKWDLDGFRSLVTFGDSYTDESRAWYFNDHGGTAPPPGWVGSVNPSTYSGGYIWPRYINWYTGVNLYNYAVSGAVCSTAITPHKGVGIQEYEMPAFLADKAYKLNGQPFLNIPPNRTIYAVWIGTNDLGWNSFLTNEQTSGKTLNDYVNCIFTIFDQIYKSGGRKFVLMNNIPLNLVPIYALPENGGLKWSKFWTNKPGNIAQISNQIKSFVEFTNISFMNKTKIIMQQRQRYPNAQMAIFDTYSLFSDIYTNPTKYLNGTAPLNVTSSVLQCFSDNTCIKSTSPDSFEWYDELHPSEQSDRLVAREFLNVVAGNSSFATYFP